MTVNSRETTANEKRRRIMIKQMKMGEREIAGDVHKNYDPNNVLAG